MLHGLLFGVMRLVLLFYHKLAASPSKYFVITLHEAGRLYSIYFTYRAHCNMQHCIKSCCTCVLSLQYLTLDGCDREQSAEEDM
jgi:hypothetical protein